MSQSFETSLHKSLEHIGKKEWATALLNIEKRFTHVPVSETSFRDELLSALWSLHEAKKIDSELPLLQVFAIRFSKFDAWTFRFIESTDQGKKYLNPLVDSDESFGGSIEVLQSCSAFPAEDIIKRWVRDHLS
ncbi:hypothetical protein GCM10011613_24840 [Cellvibrio zantedeschiae]|uniref:Uncharacterized protein n=1 Tax=Cellvibrio zantedeschiae TaxID=1237077 RepID=A0ABQ3B584_9GAMM|nr:hypothetical protein [Cellvibrio zantedeschiae]GGY79081.1 hypothetical protein GCM10011613_24840 [Cellvibrio zantedeschiae]